MYLVIRVSVTYTNYVYVSLILSGYSSLCLFLFKYISPTKRINKRLEKQQGRDRQNVVSVEPIITIYLIYERTYLIFVAIND